MMGIAVAKPDAMTVHKRIGAVCSVAWLATTIGLTSCLSKLSEYERGVIDTPIVCLNFKPISWVNSDSEKTRAQINAHNVVWDEYCKEDSDGS